MLFEVAIPLDELRTRMRDQVNGIRASLIAGGLSWGGHRYDTDPASIQNITSTIAALAVGIPLPDGFVWRDADNVDVPHDATSLVQLGGSLLDFVNSCYQRSFTLKNEIDTSGTPHLIDIESGWPT